MMDSDTRDALTVEELAGLLGMSYMHMSKLVENDHIAHIASVSYTAPARVSRAESRRERLNRRRRRGF